MTSFGGRFCALLLLAISSGCSDPESVDPPPEPDPPPPEEAAMPWLCDAGEVPIEGGCRPAGVIACGVGFESDGERGCRAILPAEACEAGRMAIPGETDCREVAPCGAGPWGDIPDDTGTLYVDQSYAGGSSDGTQAAPFVTIGEALAAVASGGTVAVAAGTYPEEVVVDLAITLRGVCPDLVEIAGPATSDAAVTMDAVGAVLQGVAVTGGGDGVQLFSDATLRELHIHDTGDFGVGNYGQDLVAEGLLIESTQRYGIGNGGGSLVLTESLIRDVVFNGGPFDGFGVAATGGSGTPGTDLTVERSVFERLYGAGIFLQSAPAVVRDTVMRDLLGDEQGIGSGLIAYTPSMLTERATAVIERSVIERAVGQALSVQESTVQAFDLTVSDTQLGSTDVATALAAASTSDDPTRAAELLVVGASVSDGGPYGIASLGATVYAESVWMRDVAGRAVSATTSTEEPPFIPSNVTLWGCDFEGFQDEAVFVFDSTLLMEGTRVAEVRETVDLPIENATGIHVLLVDDEGFPEPPLWTVRDSLLERGNGVVSLLALGGQALVERTWVRDMGPRQATGLFGRGITAQQVIGGTRRGSMMILQSRIERVHDVGVVGSGVDLVLRDSLILEAQAFEGHDGDGVLALAGLTVNSADPRANISIESTVIEGSDRVGVGTFGGHVSLQDTRLTCNEIQLNRESSDDGLEGTFDNAGGNICECDGEEVECKVLSSNLAPPPGLGATPQQ